ncbi:MAG: hypothetical protein P4N60_18980 [Verrucomicrobiae bacterium]|nr:hypothetical protein [Verrucomicrobiae bacterium]
MNNLKENICTYLAHEITPVESIINGYSLEEVFVEIESILQNSCPEEISHTLGFIRDAGLYEHPFHDAFRKHIKTPSLWGTLKVLLTSSDFFIRRNTVYTIAKLCERNRAHLLAEAFPFYLENDPINLPNLIKELTWLTNDRNWSFIEQITKAKHFAQRWSLCELLDDDGSSIESKYRYLDILKHLSSDPEPLVSAEAALRFERIKIKTGPKLPKPEWRKEIKRISSLEPRITFQKTAMQFMHGKDCYTLDEFERFVRTLT